GHAVDLRHLEVGDDHVDVVLAEHRQALLAVLGDHDVVAVTRELRRQDLAQVRLVVDDEHLLLLGKHGRPLYQRLFRGDSGYGHSMTTSATEGSRPAVATGEMRTRLQ